MRRALVVLVLLLVGCPATETEAEKQQGIDERVCGKFRDVASRADTRTDEELRGDIQDLDDRAIIASLPIRDAVHAMLVSITAGDVEKFGVDVQATSTACDAVGA